LGLRNNEIGECGEGDQKKQKEYLARHRGSFVPVEGRKLSGIFKISSLIDAEIYHSPPEAARRKGPIELKRSLDSATFDKQRSSNECSSRIIRLTIASWLLIMIYVLIFSFARVAFRAPRASNFKAGTCTYAT
jgi:hypothetical protein